MGAAADGATSDIKKPISDPEYSPLLAVQPEWIPVDSFRFGCSLFFFHFFRGLLPTGTRGISGVREFSSNSATDICRLFRIGAFTSSPSSRRPEGRVIRL